MADYLKLFHAKRLTTNEPHHLEFIKGRLAAMKVEDPKAYAEFSDFYGVDLDVKVTKEPETVTDTFVVQVDKPKRGRPSKSSTL
jgi:hypothetical protein